MLICATNLSQLRFSRLMEIYIEGNKEKAADGITLLQAEQDFYSYLHDDFFTTDGAVYYIWESGGKYVSALRLEKYRDGWIMEALETAPDRRKKGYAKQLISAVQALGEYGKIYSHVHKQNAPSLKTHLRCGFSVISESAVYIDGSVNSQAYTLLYCRETDDL